MQRLEHKQAEAARVYFSLAAEVAKSATCKQAKCGTVIVKDGVVIGQGSNGPALNNEANRTCGNSYDLMLKPKYDKTCCIHAEWRAILDACKRHADSIEGATLYFMRIDEKGNFTHAGEPYCTVCSRLTLESGIGWFALWNNEGVDIYEAQEYNQRSYGYFTSH